MGSLHFKSGAQQKFLNLSQKKFDMFNQNDSLHLLVQMLRSTVPPKEDASYCESFLGIWLFARGLGSSTAALCTQQGLHTRTVSTAVLVISIASCWKLVVFFVRQS